MKIIFVPNDNKKSVAGSILPVIIANNIISRNYAGA